MYSEKLNADKNSEIHNFDINAYFCENKMHKCIFWHTFMFSQKYYLNKCITKQMYSEKLIADKNPE